MALSDRERKKAVNFSSFYKDLELNLPFRRVSLFQVDQTEFTLLSLQERQICLNYQCLQLLLKSHYHRKI